ncbi:hypothetical protein FQZ97_622760 [compost metagenome]
MLWKAEAYEIDADGFSLPIGPLAHAWLEQRTHKCAMDRAHKRCNVSYVTGAIVTKAATYLIGKPRGDSSMS